MPPPHTIVLIGATGFIGRRVARMLIAAGHKVIAPIRTISARREDLPQELETVHCSLRADDSTLRDALGRADAVIYAAGAVRGASIQDFLPANVHGVLAVADILVQSPAPAPPLLLMSSLAASEPQLSDYARSKLDGERVLEKYPQLATTIFRPPAVYGPGIRRCGRFSMPCDAESHHVLARPISGCHCFTPMISLGQFSHGSPPKQPSAMDA